jgi:uncharacterized protein YdcH (DUF465 family)
MLAEFNAVNEEIKRVVLTPHIGDSININQKQNELSFKDSVMQ